MKGILAALIPALLLTAIASQFMLPASALALTITNVSNISGETDKVSIPHGGTGYPYVTFSKQYSQADILYCDTLVTDQGVVSSWSSEWKDASGQGTFNVQLTINIYANAQYTVTHDATVYGEGLYYGDRSSHAFKLTVTA